MNAKTLIFLSVMFMANIAIANAQVVCNGPGADPNCNQCKSTALTTCLGCKSGYKLNGGKCETTSPLLLIIIIIVVILLLIAAIGLIVLGVWWYKNRVTDEKPTDMGFETKGAMASGPMNYTPTGLANKKAGAAATKDTRGAVLVNKTEAQATKVEGEAKKVAEVKKEKVAEGKKEAEVKKGKVEEIKKL